MQDHTTYVIGVDLSDKTFDFYGATRGTGEFWDSGKLPLTEAVLWETFGDLPRSVLVIEIGTHSRWVRDTLSSMGHEVIVCDARKLRFIFSGTNKDDGLDAKALCDVALLRRSLLHPIELRSDDVHRDLVVVRCRDKAVTARTCLINTVRGVLKPLGIRLPSVGANRFHELSRKGLGADECKLVDPLLRAIETLTDSIEDYEREMTRLAKEKYPATECLRQVPGVGAVTSLAFILTLGSPERFKRSRDVGAYVGMTPGIWQSGQINRPQGITKAGNPLLRRLLVQCAQIILRQNMPDSDLKRHGLKIRKQDGKQDKGAKRRAVVAVARKLAVLLHSLWKTGEVYDPLRQHNAQAA